MILKIEDSGAGIPRTVDACDRFETTKAYGTGLGLAIALEIGITAWNNLPNRPAAQRSQSAVTSRS
jgi:signal transduction histidine kinase